MPFIFNEKLPFPTIPEEEEEELYFEENELGKEGSEPLWATLVQRNAELKEKYAAAVDALKLQTMVYNAKMEQHKQQLANVTAYYSSKIQGMQAQLFANRMEHEHALSRLKRQVYSFNRKEYQLHCENIQKLLELGNQLRQKLDKLESKCEREERKELTAARKRTLLRRERDGGRDEEPEASSPSKLKHGLVKRYSRILDEQIELELSYKRKLGVEEEEENHYEEIPESYWI